VGKAADRQPTATEATKTKAGKAADRQPTATEATKTKAGKAADRQTTATEAAETKAGKVTDQAPERATADTEATRTKAADAAPALIADDPKRHPSLRPVPLMGSRSRFAAGRNEEHELVRLESPNAIRIR